MRILVMSSFTKSLFWFRMDLMEALVAAGHQVFALGEDGSRFCEDEFARRGIQYRSIRVARTGLSPVQDWRTYRDLKAALVQIAPDKVFVYHAKTIVYGSLAAKHAGVTEVYPSMDGLGSIFRTPGLKNSAIQLVLRAQYRAAFRTSSKVFFQNNDDRAAFVSLGLVPSDKVVMVNGSGVNLEHFAQRPLPSEPVFLFVGRLIRDKGVVEYLQACRRIRSMYPGTRCLLVGPYDTNHSALRPRDLAPYLADGIVEYFGEQRDVRPYLEQCSVLVLPSYHEGTPTAVLEAMSMGRSIITTNAPGCRETVVQGHSGFLVEPRDVDDLVARMEAFIEEPRLARLMGKNGRRIAEDRFDVHKVNAVILRAMGVTAVPDA